MFAVTSVILGSAMKVLSQWRKEKKTGCTDQYVLAVRRAITMFRHCWVVDEPSKSVVNINPYEGGEGSCFNINTYLDPKPDATLALGIYIGELHPMTLVWENNTPPRPDPLHTYMREERTAAAVTLPADPATIGCRDTSVLKKFHLKEFPPYDRALTKLELQKLLVLPTQEVPFAGIFNADGKWDAKKSLKVFQAWKKNGYSRPTKSSGVLKRFLRTRNQTVRSGTATRQELLDMCEKTLIDEAHSTAAIRLFVVPYDDGLEEKKRRQALIEANILTRINAPGHVAPSMPEITDPGWKMLTLEAIEGIVFPDVLTNWLSLFTDDFKTLMRKAQGSWASGKAYAIKYKRIDDFLFVHARVGQSFSNASTKAYTVLLCFRDDGTCVNITHAKCFQCVGGEQSGWCHHVVMLLIGLMQFRMGIIKVCNTVTR